MKQLTTERVQDALVLIMFSCDVSKLVLLGQLRLDRVPGAQVVVARLNAANLCSCVHIRLQDVLWRWWRRLKMVQRRFHFETTTDLLLILIQFNFFHF